MKDPPYKNLLSKSFSSSCQGLLSSSPFSLAISSLTCLRRLITAQVKVKRLTTMDRIKGTKAGWEGSLQGKIMIQHIRMTKAIAMV